MSKWMKRFLFKLAVELSAVLITILVLVLLVMWIANQDCECSTAGEDMNLMEGFTKGYCKNGEGI